MIYNKPEIAISGTALGAIQQQISIKPYGWFIDLNLGCPLTFLTTAAAYEADE